MFYVKYVVVYTKKRQKKLYARHYRKPYSALQKFPAYSNQSVNAIATACGNYT